MNSKKEKEKTLLVYIYIYIHTFINILSYKHNVLVVPHEIVGSNR